MKRQKCTRLSDAEAEAARSEQLQKHIRSHTPLDKLKAGLAGLGSWKDLQCEQDPKLQDIFVGMLVDCAPAGKELNFFRNYHSNARLSNSEPVRAALHANVIERHREPLFDLLVHNYLRTHHPGN
jgi:hypothetical protein